MLRPLLSIPEPLCILADDCTVTYEDGNETRHERYSMLIITISTIQKLI